MPGGRTRAATKRPNGKSGRPSSLSEETIVKIEKRIRNLGSYDDAAIAGGVHPRTFERWREKGGKDFEAGKDSEYSRFYHRVEQANRDVKAILQGRVYAHSVRDGRLALKILERRWAKEWGLKVELTDSTPTPKASPRDRFLTRLASIEERQAKAAEALAGLLSSDFAHADPNKDE